MLSNFYEEPECDDEELSKLFVEYAEVKPPNRLLLPERRSLIFCINGALRCFGVDTNTCQILVYQKVCGDKMTNHRD
jgi:hypothetical protein